MIEWWQAFIFALLPLGGGVLGWFLNSRSTLHVQKQQHEFEMEMQKQRLEADRQGRSDEARRAELKKRLEPVYDALSATEQWINHHLWLQSLESSGAEETARAVAAELLPDGAPPGLVESVLDQIRTGEGPQEVKSQDVLVKIFAASARVNDNDLLDSLRALIGLLAQPSMDVGDTYLLVSAAYEKLEAYISRPAS